MIFSLPVTGFKCIWRDNSDLHEKKELPTHLCFYWTPILNYTKFRSLGKKYLFPFLSPATWKSLQLFLGILLNLQDSNSWGWGKLRANHRSQAGTHSHWCRNGTTDHLSQDWIFQVFPPLPRASPKTPKLETVWTQAQLLLSEIPFRLWASEQTNRLVFWKWARSDFNN